MKALLLWVAIAHPFPRTAHTVDRLLPPQETWVCPAKTYASGIPTRTGTWHYPPDIILCHRGPVTMDRIERAVGYWKRLGYEFGDIKIAPSDDYGCAIGQVPWGTIMIDIPSQGFKMGTHLGTTKTWRNNDTGRIFKAKIEIMSAWGDSERTLEHELGHAMGFDDVHHVGHIMNGSWSLGGYGAEGLKK
jgi:hypothetical protein